MPGKLVNVSRQLLVAAAVCAALAVSSAGAAAPNKTTAFFYRGGALTKVTVPVSGAETGAAGALATLLAGPPTGYTTSIPRGVSLVGVTTAEGTTTATFSQALGDPSRNAEGQIVATLARFPGVKHVFVAEQGRGRLVLHRGDGFALVSGARASDYVDLTPNAAIFVATPARDSTVSSPVKVSGTADTFEAAFELRVISGGTVVAMKTINATSGTGTRGTWSTSVVLPHGDVTLELFEPSAKDGTPIHKTQILLHVR